MRLPFQRSFPRRPKSVSSSASDLPVAATPSSVTLLPGDLPASPFPGYKVSPLEVRELNELIRQRYALDVDIWGQRNCRPRDRHLLLDKMERADAALLKIITIVRSWDNPHVWESAADWDRLRCIKQRLEMEGGGKRLWAGNPPWEP